ncbi:hypothetical protein [Sulfurospirillum arcachonense]|uniref:hypothetical protein n=1 Tax=Sulfurospirillum arcachonense TaxID=57666 RepID=UPI000468F124|nr:hypothetical protein [Sulfurospirillum arcachonense]
MNNTNNSFSIFLNIVLGLLFLGSLVFTYFFGNFDGISLKDLNANYRLKSELSFADLPKNIQTKYISRNKIENRSVSNASITKAFDNEGNPLVIEAEDIDDFREIVKSLQDRVVFLEKENIFLSNDKEELLKIVQHEKAKNNTDQKTLLTNNLEKINEAEQQHYKNISELTQKINDLQRENIRLSQQINGKNDLSKLEIDKLKTKIEDEKKLAKKHELEVIEANKLKFSAISNENKLLHVKLKEINNTLKEQRSSRIVDIGKKDQQITLLQNKINELMVEKNVILTKKSQAILELEKANSKKLEEFDDIIKNSGAQKEAIKEEYKKTIKKLELKYKKIIEDQKVAIATIEQKLEKQKENTSMILENAEKEILLQGKKFNEESKKIIQTYGTKLEKIKNDNSNLSNQVNQLLSENKNLLSTLETQKVATYKSNDTILQLQDKINVLENKEKNVDTEVNELVKINEEKHNKNYKILNQRIANLEKDIKFKQKENNSLLKKLTNEKTDLHTQLNDLISENNKKSENISDLQNTIASITKKKNELELNEHEKLLKIRKSFDELQTSVLKREKEYEILIQELKEKVVAKDNEVISKDKNKLDEYVREITSLKNTIKTLSEKGKTTVPISDKKRKLERIGKVECDDMNSGNFKISSTCKAKVSKFLSNYDTSNYFEVIPIVGTGGFASLNLIKRKSKLGIEDKEIERLTKLANLGLGKHRAKEGGWLIREKFGDNAKISYTVYNIEAKNKRGFVIRVYR